MDSKLTNLNQNTNYQVMPTKKTEEEKVEKSQSQKRLNFRVGSKWDFSKI